MDEVKSTAVDHIRALPAAMPPRVRPMGGARGAGLPRDLDGAGLYEDVKGNGRKDFADVVLFFTRIAWIADHEPGAALDYNGNGRIDFADVVWLFNRLRATGGSIFPIVAPDGARYGSWLLSDRRPFQVLPALRPRFPPNHFESFIGFGAYL